VRCKSREALVRNAILDSAAPANMRHASVAAIWGASDTLSPYIELVPCEYACSDFTAHGQQRA